MTSPDLQKDRSVARRWQSLQAKINEATQKHGVKAPTIVAVTKYASDAQMIAGYEAGMRDFGENRMQDVLAKKARLPETLVRDVRWHLIGHLQSNKAKKTVGEFSLIHSVDSLALAQRLSDLNEEASRKQDILLQLNLTAEESKSGITASEAETMVKATKAMPGIALRGLMTIARNEANPADLKTTFDTLASLRNTIAASCQIDLPDLSMGMTKDYIHAIESGATIIRIGSYLFHEPDT